MAKPASREALGSLRWAMFRKGMRQSRVSMERIKAAANSRLMRLAQKMIVGGARTLDRVANSHLHHLDRRERFGKYTVNFSRTPEPLPPNVRKSAGSESGPCSLTYAASALFSTRVVSSETTPLRIRN